MLLQKSISEKKVIIVGCGFLGKAAAQLFYDHGYQVQGIVRSETSVHSQGDSTFEIFSCDVTNQASVEALKNKIPPNPLLIYAVSSGKGGAEAYATIYRDGLKRVIQTWQPRRTIFVSSTSVYAQTDGENVTESSPAHPTRETGRILLEAEELAVASGGIVARFSGIYGPERSVLLKKFLDGTAIIEEGKIRWINQIHRDDGARALFHLAENVKALGIYNVTDDTPTTQQEIYQWIADYYHKPLPPLGPPDLNRKRGWTSKKISNKKLRLLGWKPYFSSYREALPNCAAAVEVIR